MSCLGLLTILAFTLPIRAGVEKVLVLKVMDDTAIIRRANGESYLIEKGVGCLSLWRHEGKRVLIKSPNLFLGVGSSLIIPGRDQECRIWDSDQIEGDSGLFPRTGPRSKLGTAKSITQKDYIVALQKALKIVGYDPGPPNGTIGKKTTEAFGAFRKKKNLGVSDPSLRLALMWLAADVQAKRPNDPEARKIATTLLGVNSIGPASSQPQLRCEVGHWVSTVTSDGSIVKLEDGSIWEIDLLDRIDTMLWLVTEEVLVCGGRLINTDNGQSVNARRLK